VENNTSSPLSFKLSGSIIYRNILVDRNCPIRYERPMACFSEAASIGSIKKMLFACVRVNPVDCFNAFSKSTLTVGEVLNLSILVERVPELFMPLIARPQLYEMFCFVNKVLRRTNASDQAEKTRTLASSELSKIRLTSLKTCSILLP